MKKIVAFFSLLYLLSACWPTSLSFRDGSMDERWQKFYVTTLENSAANAPLSYAATLTEDVRTGLQNNTRLKLSTNKEDAQVQIEGNVIHYQVTPAAIQQGDNAAKNRLTISVKFTIFINVPPKEGGQQQDEMELTATRFQDFEASQDLTSVEAVLIDDIDKQIVQDVVNKLMSNW